MIRRAELCPELIRDHPQDFGCIGFAHQSVGIELAFTLGVLGGEDMALERFTTLDLASRGLLEAFRCAFVRFQFGHKSLGGSAASVIGNQQ